MSMSIYSMLGGSQDESKSEPSSQPVLSEKEPIGSSNPTSSTNKLTSKEEIKTEDAEKSVNKHSQDPERPDQRQIRDHREQLETLQKQKRVQDHNSGTSPPQSKPELGNSGAQAHELNVNVNAARTPPSYPLALYKYQQQEQQQHSAINDLHQHHHHSHSHNHMHSHGMMHSHVVDASDNNSSSSNANNNSSNTGNNSSNVLLTADSEPVHEMQSSIARDSREVSAGPSSVGLHTHVHHSLPINHGPRHTHVHSASAAENSSHFHHHEPQHDALHPPLVQPPVGPLSHHHHHHTQQQQQQQLQQQQNPENLSALSNTSAPNTFASPYYYFSSNEKLIVGSREVYDSIKHFPRHSLGSMVYVLDDYCSAATITNSRVYGAFSLDESRQMTKIPVMSSDPGVFDLKDAQLERVDGNSPIIPRFEGKENMLFEVRIPRKYLSRKANPNVDEQQRLWGTDVYSDDSDIVAVLYHMGILPLDEKSEMEMEKETIEPKDAEKEAENAESNDGSKGAEESKDSEGSKEPIESKSEDSKDSSAKDLESKDPKESKNKPRKKTKARRKLNTKLIQSLSGYKRAIDSISSETSLSLSSSSAQASNSNSLESSGDLIVTLVILPRLLRYTGSYRNGLYSRDWGAPSVPHDGVSYAVMGVRFVAQQDLAGIPSGKRARVDQWHSEFRKVFADVLEEQREKKKTGKRRGQQEQQGQEQPRGGDGIETVGIIGESGETKKRVQEEWMLNGDGYPEFRLKPSKASRV